MTTTDYSTSFLVDQSPGEVFQAITNVRGWWSNTIQGETGKPGAEFTFQHKDVHRTTQKVTGFEPGKRIVWHVTESQINFVKDKNEWKDTEVVFEIARKDGKTEVRFTHAGLVPAIECYGRCSGAWDFYVNGSLQSLIATGEGKPIQEQ
ncbi:MAG: SRPBCC domain-containing protein [Bryobacterales bacterium]|nr:SRPBCC domain-containing protein [Bryobacterales bacterium]